MYGIGGLWKLSVPSPGSCYDPKIGLKNHLTNFLKTIQRRFQNTGEKGKNLVQKQKA